MQISIKREFQHSRIMIKYTLLTLLSAFGCSLLGYVFLPFAAAFYAAVLLFENPGRRVVSYVLPAVVFAMNLLLRGFYSLEAVAYLIVGLIIYVCIKRGKSKGETAFWISFAVLVCMVISAVLLILEFSNGAGYASFRQFFSDTYAEYKEVFLNTITSLVREDADGIQFFAFNLYEANMLLRELIVYLVPVAFLLSFMISGLTLKVFCKAIERNVDDNREIYSWNFATSNIVSYFFICVSVFAMIINSDASMFFYVIFTLNTVFTAVFAYIGLKSLYIMLSLKKSKAFAIVLMVLGFALLSSFAFQAVSYFGAIVNILTNKVANSKRNGT